MPRDSRISSHRPDLQAVQVNVENGDREYFAFGGALRLRQCIDGTDDLSSRAHQNFAQIARDGHVVFDNQNSDLSKHNLRPLFETVVSLGLAGTRANASQSRQPFNFMSEQTLFADEPVCI